ncbi:hypothetical protein DL770_006292 [Monosporascus sp. CRB-9-2]|nr:hypothetical protein DL770_006292 [Monosporascus sp. CRB-9-2]
MYRSESLPPNQQPSSDHQPRATSNAAMDNIREALRAMGVPESSIPANLPSVISVPASNEEGAQVRSAFAKLDAPDAWGKPDLLALAPYMQAANRAAIYFTMNADAGTVD